MDEQQLEDFDKLIEAFISIGNKMDGTKILNGEEYFYNAEGLGKKILHHIVTTRHLFNGYQLGLYEPQIDFASIAIITRAALETYLTLHYFFIAPQSDDEKEFKLQSWYLGGLDRIKFKPDNEDLTKWHKEVELSQEIVSKIKKTKYFNQLVPRNQAKILNGEWKLKGWNQIASEAGFNEYYFRKIYSFLCRYAHSNRQSIIQIQQIVGLKEQRSMALAFIGIAMTVLAKYAYDYIEIMPGLKGKVNQTSTEYKIILEYKIIGESLSEDKT